MTKGDTIMFNTMNVAKKIKNARIEKNLTQMNLADFLGVSYQAVSNWERGNSMPDISKLNDLCSLLNLSIDELLSDEPKTANAIHKFINEDTSTITLEEVADIAPLLSPQKLDEVINESSHQEEYIPMSILIALAPFIEDESLEQLSMKTKCKELHEAVALAPFISSTLLEELLADFNDIVDDSIVALAPFVSKKTIDRLTISYLTSENCDMASLVALCPFLSREIVRKIADHLIKVNNYDGIASIAPFM